MEKKKPVNKKKEVKAPKAKTTKPKAKAKSKTTKPKAKAKSKKEETEIVVVLDRSGSMGMIDKSTVEGFNKFLTEQQNAKGKAFITLVQFDDRYEMNYKSVPVKDAKSLILGETFVPRGSTALLDAIGKTIEELKTDRDVVFVIITDGEENASQTYKQEAIHKMIRTQTDKEGWKFLFLGAGQDAIKTGGNIGISHANSMTYSANATSNANTYVAFSGNISRYRSAKVSSKSISLDEAAKSLDFDDDQRDKSK